MRSNLRTPQAELWKCSTIRARLIVPLSGHAFLELAHPAPERPSDLRQPLRAADEQEQHDDQHDLLDADEGGHFYCPRLAGSTPAKVKKSFLRKEEPAEVSVGVHFRFWTKHELGSLCSRSISNSATIRPPT